MSLGDFKIKLAKDRLLSTGPWVAITSLKHSSTVYRPGRNILVECNLKEGIRIQSDSAVILPGSACGTQKDRCHITASGEVIVEGDLSYAHVKGRTIRIGGQARKCVLVAAEGVEVGGGMSGAKIRVGETDVAKRNLVECRRELQRLRSSHEFTERQFAIDQRRVPRYMGKTQLNLDYGIGDIVKHWVIHHTGRRIEIDLNPLYELLAGKSEADVDAALKELISAGIVESMAGVNRRLIGSNPVRRKVFMQAMHKLQGLLALARTIDKQRATIEETEQRIDRLARTVGAYCVGVHTRGRILPDVDLTFRRPILVNAPGGQSVIEEHQASFKLRAAASTKAFTIEEVSTRGETRTRQVRAEAPLNARFGLNTSWVEWSSARGRGA